MTEYAQRKDSRILALNVTQSTALLGRILREIRWELLPPPAPPKTPVRTWTCCVCGATAENHSKDPPSAWYSQSFAEEPRRQAYCPQWECYQSWSAAQEITCFGCGIATHQKRKPRSWQVQSILDTRTAGGHTRITIYTCEECQEYKAKHLITDR